MPARTNRSDAALSRAVEAMLAWSLLVPRASIRVEAIDHDVLLTGHLEDWRQHEAAMSCARSVLGVRKIVDRISVGEDKRALAPVRA